MARPWPWKSAQKSTVSSAVKFIYSEQFASIVTLLLVNHFCFKNVSPNLASDGNPHFSRNLNHQIPQTHQSQSTHHIINWILFLQLFWGHSNQCSRSGVGKTFPVKGQIANILGCASRIDSTLCLCSTKAAMEYIKAKGHGCAFTTTGGGQDLGHRPQFTNPCKIHIDI